MLKSVEGWAVLKNVKGWAVLKSVQGWAVLKSVQGWAVLKSVLRAGQSRRVYLGVTSPTGSVWEIQKPCRWLSGLQSPVLSPLLLPLHC